MKKEIPEYKLDDHYRRIHRDPDIAEEFGYNRLNPSLRIPDFELYSSIGLLRKMGPLRSAFYRVGLTIRGTCDVQLGLEHYTHRTGTVNCTYPNMVFSKDNISEDSYGYYLNFNAVFLNSLIPEDKIAEEFPFFSYSGIPFFQLEEEAVLAVKNFILRINEELQQDKPEKDKAVRLYLYLLLLEIKRSYQQQGLHAYTGIPESSALVMRFKKLVAQYFLEKQQVSEYAELLHVTPDHLNRTVRELSGKTASSHISEMIGQEARVLLRYTDLSVSEISWRLRFSEPSSFNRFFKKETELTPLEYRNNVNV